MGRGVYVEMKGSRSSWLGKGKNENLREAGAEWAQGLRSARKKRQREMEGS